LDDEDDDQQATTTSTTMPPPSTRRAQVAPTLPPPPSTSLCGGRVPSGPGCGSQPLQSQTMRGETPIVHRSREKKLEVSRGKKKF